MVTLSNCNNKAGKRVRLVIIAKSKVIEVSFPKATVPPKSDAAKITKPKNKMIEVYTILYPVSLRLLLIANETLKLLLMSS